MSNEEISDANKTSRLPQTNGKKALRQKQEKKLIQPKLFAKKVPRPNDPVKQVQDNPNESLDDMRQELKRKVDEMEEYDDTYALEHLEELTMDGSWYEALNSEFKKAYFLKLKSFLAKQILGLEKKVFPPMNDWYSWSRYCPIEEVKVVIIGQDPYHNDMQAHGLCFSVQEGVKLPPSLINIFKELQLEYQKKLIDSAPASGTKNGSLVGWAKQGVLLLNAVLTVEAHKANSHQAKGWETFTDAVIKVLLKTKKNIVFMLWGNYAAKKASSVNPAENLLLKAVHPSPLSAHRGFFGCDHFAKANEYLVKHGQTPIDWGKSHET